MELDERLLATPALALSRSRAVAADMAEHAVRALKDSLTAIDSYSPALAERIRQDEELCDHYEDILSTYLVKLSAEQMGAAESEEAAALLESLLISHPFVDGNKRVAFAACDVFLRINGWRLHARPDWLLKRMLEWIELRDERLERITLDLESCIAEEKPS